ncbi:MAG: replication initiation protein [Nitrospirae bacterium]|nr:replication initiation protein [Nitrospirota bacterium]
MIHLPVEIDKESDVVQLSSEITSQQRKVFNALIYIARSTLKNQLNTNIFYTDLSIIKKLADIRDTNNEKYQQILEDLVHIIVKYKSSDKNKKEDYGLFNLLASVKINQGNIEFSFAHQIIKTLLNPDLNKAIDINIIKGFSSDHSIILYELCSKYIYSDIPQMSIDEFRTLMGIEEVQYKNSNDLVRYVIESAVKEVSEKTDMIIHCETFKKWNRITHVKFSVTDKNIMEDVSMLHYISDDIEGKELSIPEDDIGILTDLIPEKHRNKKTILYDISSAYKKHGFYYVKYNIQYANLTCKDNYRVCLKNALKNNEGMNLKETYGIKNQISDSIKCRGRKKIKMINEYCGHLNRNLSL